MRILLASAGTGLVAAAGLLVNGRPRPAFGFALGYPSLFIAFGDVIRLAFLLIRVLVLVAWGHWSILVFAFDGNPVQTSQAGKSSPS